MEYAKFTRVIIKSTLPTGEKAEKYHSIYVNTDQILSINVHPEYASDAPDMHRSVIQFNNGSRITVMGTPGEIIKKLDKPVINLTAGDVDPGRMYHG